MSLNIQVLALDIDGDGIQDNLNEIAVDSNNDGFDDSYSPVTAKSLHRDILIVHKTQPLVYFGWYRTSQMTAPGWDLYQRAIDWADGGSVPANTDVILFTYNGTLDPNYSAEKDGIAVYNYLIGAGYNVGEVHHQADIESLPSSHYGSFDLAIYAWAYPRDATNIVNSGIPFISASSGETDEMGIGTGLQTMHEYRNNFYVVNNTHYITQPYSLGWLTFTDSMWTDASEASSDGIVLVTADEILSPTIDIKADPNPATIGNPLDVLLDLENPGGAFSAFVGLYAIVGKNIIPLYSVVSSIPAGFSTTDYLLFSTISLPQIPDTIALLCVLLDNNTDELLALDTEIIWVDTITASPDASSLMKKVEEYVKDVNIADFDDVIPDVFGEAKSAPPLVQEKASPRGKLSTMWGELRSK
jgi:hypothetical protein